MYRSAVTKSDFQKVEMTVVREGFFELPTEVTSNN